MCSLNCKPLSNIASANTLEGAKMCQAPVEIGDVWVSSGSVSFEQESLEGLSMCTQASYLPLSCVIPEFHENYGDCLSACEGIAHTRVLGITKSVVIRFPKIVRCTFPYRSRMVLHIYEHAIGHYYYELHRNEISKKFAM